MPDALSVALAALFADPNIGRDAVYIAEGGAPKLVRVVARLAPTIRSEQFPKATPSLNAAALVSSKAPVIAAAHDTGPLIRSRNGLWLAIPTPAAGKSLRGLRRGSASTTPGEWERRTGLRLRFIYRRWGPSLLVAEGRLNTKGRAFGRPARPHSSHDPASPSRSKTGRGIVTAPIFLPVRQVKLPMRLDLARDADRALDSVPKDWLQHIQLICPAKPAAPP
ncbi:MAG: DUF6441 family protein [Gemmobacter sp.]